MSDGSLERSDWPVPPSYCVSPVAVLDVEILVADEASEGASVANENTLGTILSVKMPVREFQFTELTSSIGGG